MVIGKWLVRLQTQYTRQKTRGLDSCFRRKDKPAKLTAGNIGFVLHFLVRGS
ncbi:MAG: hypothetical protein JSW23_03720 [Planctomycetota bacterium]|nr:MAG: hypothetical protein JSW23_03720 [Planctomycetota bacterium]